MATTWEHILARFPLATAAPPLKAPVKLLEVGPFAWLQPDGPVPARGQALLWVDGGWAALEGPEAFRRVLLDVRPALADWAPVVDAWRALFADAPLLTREDVEGLADPRWYLFPLTPAGLAAWRPPTFDGQELTFEVERFPHQGARARVRVGADYRVEVEELPR